MWNKKIISKSVQKLLTYSCIKVFALYLRNKRAQREVDGNVIEKRLLR